MLLAPGRWQVNVKKAAAAAAGIMVRRSAGAVQCSEARACPPALAAGWGVSGDDGRQCLWAAASYCQVGELSPGGALGGAGFATVYVT